MNKIKISIKKHQKVILDLKSTVTTMKNSLEDSIEDLSREKNHELKTIKMICTEEQKEKNRKVNRA